MSVWRFDAIGTRWEIETESLLDDDERAAVDAVIVAFDRTWSRFRADSLVSSLARTGGEVPSPADAVAMLDAYRELSDATDGAVNPLVGESLSALGYDATVSLVAGAPRPAPAGWAGILTWTDSRLTVASPRQIDVGALGKGRLVDLVLAELAGVRGNVTVDAGGDIAVRGDEVRIGLEHPFDQTKAIGVASIRDQALCASAINRRAWGDGLHHVLDARTGVPVRTWAATWAIAPDAMHADAVATALFFDGGAELAARWGVEWVRMSTAGIAERSPNCPVELFTTPGIRR
ncbi:FAD:protein FMN transferase [Microbacterium murale]|uniref:FAD:protein FMN transferase n=1 Tax=Microbacterium murale TaxID=1081040 RepID=A0ABQ1RTJ4_9MICO|nr:FAD:protein FMN transferase [Microbacterium murale]GGD82135.1 FAD:protein FMN transferase [Microbacterium murale]